ncbi:MlaD family protein [Synechocystis sp. LKSZ1]|uniref:MlaD family protein n=1 Tax=Synechocystis sp. LKSZ1 TaxID=3144951 RepID=UPI00336BD317
MLRPRAIQEGSVGLFALLGLVLLGGFAVWLRGGGFGSPGYRLRVNFDDASGLQVGAPVRFRGISVGKVAGLSPSSNGITALLEISSNQLKIPKDSLIQIGRYGLIGEASVDISPQHKLSEQALALDPLAKDCEGNADILCHDQELTGETGSQLVNSLTRLSQAYSDPVFIASINTTIRNASKAAASVAKMSDEIGLLSKSAREQIRGVGRTTTAITGVADNAALLTQNLNQVVSENQASLGKAIQEASQLMGNLNQLVRENRLEVGKTLTSIQSTSTQLQALGKEMEVTLKEVNQGLSAVDSQRLAKNLDTILANTAATTDNLRKISTSLNDPTLLFSIQQTLDSARLTFSNTQKITSDIEQLTGDPVFRSNLKKLVDGLGNLVSSTEHLERQVYAAKLLETNSQQLQYHIDLHQRLLSYHQITDPDRLGLALLSPVAQEPATMASQASKQATPVPRRP